MTWEEAVEVWVAEQHHERARYSCSDQNPNVVNRRQWRALVIAYANREDLSRFQQNRPVHC